MNELLKLLGEKYKMSVQYEYYEGYVVTVTQDDMYASSSFRPIEAELAGHDVFLYTVEQCILELKHIKERRDRGGLKND